MIRLSKVLIAAAATIAVPVQTALAQDDAPVVEGEAGVEAGASVDATGDATAPPVEATVEGSVAMGWPGSIIDRPLVLMAGKLAAHADILIARASFSSGTTSVTSTSELLAVGAAYGVADKITAGASYAFTLNEFEIKGPLTVYGSFGLTDNGKLSVAAGADLVADLGGVDAMGESTVELAIHAGLAVRYKLAPKFAVYSGNPYQPGPSGQHLTIGLSDGAAKSFALPVGFAAQVTPQLYTYAQTTLATILLSDPGMGDRVAFIGSDAGGIPLALGGWFNINKNIDAGASLNFPDLNFAGDFFIITVGARYYN